MYPSTVYFVSSTYIGTTLRPKYVVYGYHGPFGSPLAGIRFRAKFRVYTGFGV